jgi:hypothetical protein
MGILSQIPCSSRVPASLEELWVSNVAEVVVLAISAERDVGRDGRKLYYHIS